MAVKTKKSMLSFAIIAFLIVGGVLLNIFIEKSSADVKTAQVKITTTVLEVMALACDKNNSSTPIALGNLTPGTPVTGQTVCTATTNANGGYDLAVKRDNAPTLNSMPVGAAQIADSTAWDSTASAGAGNAAVWAGNTTLGFTVFASTAYKNTTWWGTGTTAADAANKYAGFPASFTAAANIMSYNSYNSAPTTTSAGVKLDVPGTQKSGAYSGTITFQATTKP